MAEKDVYITGEVLDLFWDCLDEDIFDNEFQEQIGNDLEELNKLKKRSFGELLLCCLLCEKCFHSFIFLFSKF